MSRTADVPSMMQAANRLLREGRFAEAIAAYQRLLAVRGDLPDAWYNLAYLHRHSRQFEEALTAYGEALRHGASAPDEIHINRAVILSECLGQGQAAEAELRTALAGNPRSLLAWLNLGNLYEDWGDVAAARAAYEEALAVAPGNGRALARLTAIDIFEGLGAARIPMLEEALARPGLGPDDAADIRFALAAALDSAGDYDRAFGQVAAANRLAAARIGPAGRYDRAAHEGLIDALIAAPLPEPLPPPAPDAPTPVFICGMFRSGSTLAESLLGRHSQLAAGGELDTIPALVAGLRPYPTALSTASPSQLARMRDDYLERLRSLHPNATMVTDKRPDNFLHIGLIKTLFPAARIVHTKRQPLDNLLSIYFLYFEDSVSYGSSLEDAAHWYGLYRRLMSHWQSRFGADIHDLDYDALVSDPAPIVEAAQRFLNLPPESLLAAAEPSGMAVRTPSAWQVRRPLHGRSSGRWRHYAAHLAGARVILGL